MPTRHQQSQAPAAHLCLVCFKWVLEVRIFLADPQLLGHLWVKKLIVPFCLLLPDYQSHSTTQGLKLRAKTDMGQK